jgi:hypothetical protein
MNINNHEQAPMLYSESNDTGRDLEKQRPSHAEVVSA